MSPLRALGRPAASARRRLPIVAAGGLAGTLLLAAVALAASHEITIADQAFEPASLTVLTGEPVTWINASGVTHTVTSDEGTELDSGPIGAGEAFGHVFDTAGVFAYHCAIHSSMAGTITVTASATTPAPSGSPSSSTPIDGILGTILPVVIVGGLSGMTVLALARRQRPRA